MSEQTPVSLSRRDSWGFIVTAVSLTCPERVFISQPPKKILEVNLNGEIIKFESEHIY